MVEPRPDRTVGDSNPAEYGLPRQVAACMTGLLSGQGVAREPPVQPVVPPPASGGGEFQDQNEWQAEWQLVLVRACLERVGADLWSCSRRSRRSLNRREARPLLVPGPLRRGVAARGRRVSGKQSVMR